MHGRRYWELEISLQKIDYGDLQRRKEKGVYIYKRKRR